VWSARAVKGLALNSLKIAAGAAVSYDGGDKLAKAAV